MKKKIKILAIESSCDETAAAVISEVDEEPIILSNIISSQVDLHAKTGGVVPEVASRAHVEAIIPVITEALLKSKSQIDSTGSVVGSHGYDAEKQLDSSEYNHAITMLRNEISHIAVTAGPGLIGSLLVGFNAAKALAYALDKPLFGINHIEGHIYSAFGGAADNQLDDSTIFPVLALTVSGGHTSLTLMKNHGDYQQIGQTLDDAVGEAYDKVAKLMGLGYPGGPIVSKLANDFRAKSQNLNFSADDNSEVTEEIKFPRPIINDGTFNFSFSGLKTAVLQRVKEELEMKKNLSEEFKKTIAAAFEEAVKDVLTAKTRRAVGEYTPKTLIFAGGVSANHYLRESLKDMAEEQDIKFLTPKPGLFGDNAAMIGIAAYYHIEKGEKGSWNQPIVDSGWELV